MEHGSHSNQNQHASNNYVGVGYRRNTKTALNGGGGAKPNVPVPVAVVLGGCTTGIAYAETISAQGGYSPCTYAVTAGTLPTSTSLNTSTGSISGTPTVAGIYSFTITVTDSLCNVGTQSFSITVSVAVAGGGAFTFIN